MHTEELIIMAKNDGFLEKSELEAKIAFLKAQGCRILECILYVRHNQECRLQEAMNLVINTPAWLSQKDAFLKHQEEQTLEFLEAAADDIEEIQQEITPEGTKMLFKMKPKNQRQK
jgi:chromosome condensin MukBEF ATPase and DNA-binding subunit MukB